MSSLIDKILAEPLYLTIAVVLVLIILYSIFKRIIKLLLLLLIAAIAFLTYVHYEGGTVKDTLNKAKEKVIK